jgi:serine protease AprX
MIFRSVILLIFLSVSVSVICQDSYLVIFADKNGVSFDPYTYFDKKAIDRRIKLGISLYEESDFPVNEAYISTVISMVESSDIALRWFNALPVEASHDQIKNVSQLPFVKEIISLNQSFILAGKKNEENTGQLNDSDLNLLFKQLDRMNATEFIHNSIDGTGVRIAIFDGGFPNYDVHPAFAHIRNENRILNTWDFTKKDKNVSRGNSHGTATFSCVGGMYEDKKVGLATGAEFLLAITEVNSEPFKEEKWWLAAVEWADKNGADIISSSLGYVNQRYFPEEMDGHHSLVSKAARIAARKGMLVVNAAGNEGTRKSWKTVITPADVDSVLTVGGIHPETNFHTSFSSFGPAAGGTLKPNVSAYGHVIAASKNSYSETQGTSFSCPLVAGFAACAWQTSRDLTNMQLFREIERSGDLYPYFDYAHGYGIPQASYFMKQEDVPVKPTFEIIEDGDLIKVYVLDDFFAEEYDTSMMDDSEHIEEETIYNEKDFGIENMENDTIIEIPAPDKVIEYKYKENDAIENEGNLDDASDYQEIEDTIESDLPVEDEIYNEERVKNDILFNYPNYIDYLYYNIQGENGILKNYHVIQVMEKEVISIQKGKPGTTLNVYYKGYTQSLKF